MTGCVGITQRDAKRIKVPDLSSKPVLIHRLSVLTTGVLFVYQCDCCKENTLIGIDGCLRQNPNLELSSWYQSLRTCYSPVSIDPPVVDLVVQCPKCRDYGFTFRGYKNYLDQVHINTTTNEAIVVGEIPLTSLKRLKPYSNPDWEFPFLNSDGYLRRLKL